MKGANIAGGNCNGLVLGGKHSRDRRSPLKSSGKISLRRISEAVGGAGGVR